YDSLVSHIVTLSDKRRQAPTNAVRSCCSPSSMTNSFQLLYSITVSARVSSVAGTSRPPPLSTLVGARPATGNYHTLRVLWHHAASEAVLVGTGLRFPNVDAVVSCATRALDPRHLALRHLAHHDVASRLFNGRCQQRTEVVLEPRPHCLHPRLRRGLARE